MLAQKYAIAVKQTLDGGMPLEKAITSLDRVLKVRGHTKLMHLILRELRKLYAERRGATPTVRVAREEDMKTLRSQIEAALGTLKASGENETQVDDSLIGGFVAEYKGKRIDRSYKQILITLYQNTIEHQ